MISRVAGSCFWMCRYMERVENAARMQRVNHSLLLDVNLPVPSRWRPLVIVAGEDPRFTELFSGPELFDGEIIQEYLTWDERSPASIMESIRWARENARWIRETVSLEMWECLNEFWLWKTSPQARRLYRKDRHAFYSHVIERCQLFHGFLHNTILHTEGFDFMRLGILMERAGQTSRILDVKYHMFGANGAEESPAEIAHWLALLKTCAASESFQKRARTTLSGPAAASFLLHDNDFPRAVLYSLNRAAVILARNRPKDMPEIGREPSELLAALIERVKSCSPESIPPGRLHEELTHIIDGTAQMCEALQRDFFDPVFVPDRVLESLEGAAP